MLCKPLKVSGKQGGPVLKLMSCDSSSKNRLDRTFSPRSDPQLEVGEVLKIMFQPPAFLFLV